MFLKIFVQCILINAVFSISNHPILIIVSYDAFRYNFFDTKYLPQMSKLKLKGTYTDYLINVFPTKTFPNHHSIATGLYPETHGVIDNTFFDRKLGKTVNISYELYHYNEEIVPIWRQNEDMGKDRFTGVMMWPGGIYPYQNKTVTYFKEFQTGYDWFKRIDTAISWITDREKPANLVMIYIEEPDTHGHAFGPNSPVIEDFLLKLDNITQYLENKLIANGLTNKANVIHLSDHGMIAVKKANFINISQYLTKDTYEMVGASPILQITPKEGYLNEIYKKLKSASTNQHFKVYKKENYLERWHYKNNSRIAPIIVMADLGYALDDLIIAAPKYAKYYHFNLTNSSEFGVHGYDYIEKDMHPFFMARGPKIKENNKVPPFNTIDLYNLFCKILEIPPLPNNGSLGNIDNILEKTNNGRYSLSAILLITVVGVLCALALISCAAGITLFMIKRQQSITTTAALNKRFPQTFQSNIEAQHLLEPEDA